MTNPTVCPVCLRRPRRVNAMTCEHCPATITRNLREIPTLAAGLELLDVERDDAARDPVAASLPSGPVPGVSRAPRVGGSRESGVPARLDLLGPAYRGSEGITDPYGDQVGEVSVAAVLDSWCRDWITYDWCKAGRLPYPSIPDLCTWLGLWLEDACDEHPAVDDFAGELRDVHTALRRASGLAEPRPVLCDGVVCRRCDMRALYRMPGSPYIECGGCGLLYTEEEYRDWLALLAAAVKKGKAA